MPKKVRKFIEPKKAITFQLVHRSQQDPLITDENAPQRVLVPVEKNKLDKKKRIEEQHKYGIYFDDDYDYLQHLRDATETTMYMDTEIAENESTLKLPSSVFASAVQEDVGLLNKAAPHSGPKPELDPDIIAALDDDFDYNNPDNILEDNFIKLANADCLESESENELQEEHYSDTDSNFSSEALDTVHSTDMPQFTFKNEETKSHFTEYSISSSVIRRNEQLHLLDDRFEQMFADYSENEVGALDCDEIEGYIPEHSDVLLKYAEEFQDQRKRELLNDTDIKNDYLIESPDKDDVLVEIEIPEKVQWDCETIRSISSNIYNHPKIINEPAKHKIKISGGTGIPLNVLGTDRLSIKNVMQLNKQNTLSSKMGPAKSESEASLVTSALSTLSIRPKGETGEERKERKRQLKEYRRERRQIKKVNALAFKDEAKRQAKLATNNRNNTVGNKII